MSARRLALLAAVLASTALHLRHVLEDRRAQADVAELRRRMLEHRCPPRAFAVPVSDFLKPTMPDLPRLTPEPLTDPALEGPRG